jgi:alanyl-tRNA synthetase
MKKHLISCFVGVFAVAGIFAGQVHASGSRGDTAADLQAFKTCATITDNAKRLACFDKASSVFDFVKVTKVLKEAKSLKKEAEKAKAKVKELAKEAADKEKALAAKRVDQFGQKDAEVRTVNLVETEILKVKKPRVGGIVIMLANQQVWRVVGGDTPGPLKPGMKVKVRKTRMGGFLLTVELTRRTLRVKRII